MNVIETKKLKEALERLWLVVPKRGTIPMLQNLRWKVADGRVELMATDLDNLLQVSIPLRTAKTGKGLDVLVPAEAFSQAVKAESSPTALVGVRDGKFEVRTGSRVVVLPCDEPDSFPQVPSLDKTPRAQLLSSALKGALARTLFCVSREPGRYTLDVLRLEIHKSLFRLVGTDGHRLSWVEGAAKNGAGADVATLVFHSTARLLARFLSRIGRGWIDFATSPTDSGEEFHLFQFPDGTRLIGRRAPGQFPNYEAVMPQAPVEATIVFHREELLEGLAKLWPVAQKEKDHAVAFEFSQGRTVIRTEANGTRARAELGQTHVSGKARKIGFNHTYLMQFVKSVETETLSMRLFPQRISEAVLFDGFRYRYLVMPLRV